ncbi:nucleoside recognition domain-containing protein [Anaeromassilibacillus senegalensis]|uniref:Spore maturation protein A n=1 Tax=Anaeromassilibacillus senegalensis TaxID=1673717 RepID=A0ABS9CLN0_9FIRM|nr:nucleoside recognition domain-containing protein [Anaeromassilibacillus senegalensis]MCF2652031.1 spore maturation protein A [Anaeromassilibacillus senegalensis]
MLNAIWMGMIVLSFAGALMTGNLTALSKAAADGAQNAVTTALLLLGAMCLWLGMMNIAREAGVTAWLSRALSPLIRRLFPEYAGEKAVHEKISMNLAANMLGMGNAATPFGLAAMDEMQRLSGGYWPTKGMVLFVVMNTAAFQLIPSSVVTLRAAYGSADPYDIMVHIWFVSLGSLLLCIAVCKVLERFTWKS